MTEKQNIQREPLVRLAKRDDLSGAKKWAIRLMAIVLALVVGSLFIAVLGHNPIAVYHDIITGSLGGPSTAKVTVRVAIPLLGAALAIAPAFKMKFWNIGADPSGTGFPIIAMFDQKARLPKVGGVHIGWIIVLALTVGMFIYMKYSKHGYEISVVGESQRTARYAGMNVGKIIMRTMFLSGAIAGLMGFLVVSGADYTLNNGTSGGVGFTAIIVAWLAHLNPFAMVLIAGLLAVLTKGSNTIQTNFKIPASAADVLSAIILFFMLGCEFFINYRMIFRGSKAKVPAGPAPATPAASPDTAEKEADEHE